MFNNLNNLNKIFKYGAEQLKETQNQYENVSKQVLSAAETICEKNSGFTKDIVSRSMEAGSETLKKTIDHGIQSYQEVTDQLTNQLQEAGIKLPSANEAFHQFQEVCQTEQMEKIIKPTHNVISQLIEKAPFIQELISSLKTEVHSNDPQGQEIKNIEDENHQIDSSETHIEPNLKSSEGDDDSLELDPETIKD